MRPCLSRSYTMESNQPPSAQRPPKKRTGKRTDLQDLLALSAYSAVKVGSRLRLGDGRIAASAPAFAWGRACGPEADGFVPTDRPGHTFRGPGKRRPAIHDR